MDPDPRSVYLLYKLFYYLLTHLIYNMYEQYDVANMIEIKYAFNLYLLEGFTHCYEICCVLVEYRAPPTQTVAYGLIGYELIILIMQLADN